MNTVSISYFRDAIEEPGVSIITKQENHFAPGVPVAIVVSLAHLSVAQRKNLARELRRNQRHTLDVLITAALES